MNIHQSMLPTIALVPGDCTGIGPEQTARILADRNLADVARLVVVGDARVLEMGMSQAGVRIEIERVASPRQASRKHGVVPLVDLANTDPSLFPLGKASAESGRLTGETLSRAIDFAKAGEVDAITFAPLNKRAMFDGGWKFPDEHKMFANLLGHRGYFSEMNVLDGQWMSRVTRHQSLREAIDSINAESITDAIKLRGFNRGVTVTAGLDIVFTTPSHGTAFDIVGKGVAKTGALESAVRLAAQLVSIKVK